MADEQGPTPSDDEPVTVLYFYKTRWGTHDEFESLFERNHWPFLKAGLADGHYLEVKRYVPRFHGDGRADWDILVSITYPNFAALAEHAPRGLAGELFVDQEQLAADEHRRFGLLEAHWDVVLEERPLPA